MLQTPRRKQAAGHTARRGLPIRIPSKQMVQTRIQRAVTALKERHDRFV